MFVDPLQAVGASRQQVKPGFGWEGINDTQCGCAPPDVQLAASPSQVAEAVNLQITVWSTSGALVSSESLFQFYGVSPSTTFLSDPRITYDNVSGRWFTSLFGSTTTGNFILIAVSSTSNASGNWTVTKLRPASGDLPDQPILGVSQDLVSVATNDFSSSNFAGSEYWVINKSALVQGVSAAFSTFGPYSGDFSIHPVRYDGSMSGMYLVETFQGGPGSISVFSVSGVPPAGVTALVQSVAIGNATSPLSAAQPGTSSTLDTSSVHVEDAEWSAGRLWVTFDDSCFIGVVNSSCIRLVQLNVSGVASVRQDFDVAVNNSDLLYGTISVGSHADLFVTFGLSSRTADPSIVATEQGASDPLGSVRPAVPLRNGSGALACGGVCRYGDYFGSGAQPGSDWVWQAGEYVTPTNNWQSWVAAVLPGGPMGAQASASPSASDIGLAVQVSVNLSNSSCVPGGPARCSVTLPFGDGTSAWSNCTTFGPVVTYAHTYPQPGVYRPGVGGTVALFSSSPCSPTHSDGTVPISGAAVLINATPVLGLSVAPGPGIDLGQAFNVTGSPTGGVGSFTYVWSNVPPGCAGTGLAWFVCAPSSEGDYSVIANATDQVGGWAVASANLHVDADPNVTLSAPSNRAEVGAAIVLGAIASGGSSVYSFVWHGLPAGCGGANTSSLACTPTAVGSTSVAVTVTDSRGLSATSSVWNLTVGPRLIVQLQPSSGDVAAGDPVSLTTVVTGGFGPWTYHWTSLPLACGDASGPNVTCHPAAGSYHVQVTVTDGIGAIANASADFSAHSGANPFGSLQSGTSWILVAVGVAVAAGLTALYVRRRRARRPPPE